MVLSETKQTWPFEATLECQDEASENRIGIDGACATDQVVTHGVTMGLAVKGRR